MPLVYIADDLNSVNEAHRSLYVKDDNPYCFIKDFTTLDDVKYLSHKLVG